VTAWTAAELHQALVDRLVREGSIRSARVEAAFRAVPRHPFLPDLALEEVYRDEAIPTKQREGRAISSSSQPTIMAIMLEQLSLEPGQRVLEIGAGTGYNAALIAHIVGEGGRVVTLDLDEDIVAGAREHLAAAGFERVQVVCADGGFGYSPGAPYDRIMLTVGAGDIAPAWREQLAPDGCLVLPLAMGDTQKSIAFQETGDGLVSRSIVDCGFIMLRGAFAEAESVVQVGPDPGIRMSAVRAEPIDGDGVYRLLTGSYRDRATGVRVTPREIWGGLNLWLALHEPELCGLTAQGEAGASDVVPMLLGVCGSKWKYHSTSGLLGTDSLSVFARPAGESLSPDASDDTAFELHLRTFGPDDALAQRLVDHLQTWHAAGRPSTDGLRVRAYPADSDYVPAPREIVMRKRFSLLVLDWPA
jgi:protein-L-isoaspartate(D-aspartate) O-methyltransferase